MNLKQQLFLNNINNSSNLGNNMNLNFGKLNNNFDIYDQTRNKFSMKFFEKLNLNNNKNNKGLKYSNMNDLTNTLNKNKLNNIKKDAIQIYNKDKNNSKNKITEKKLINKIKTKKPVNVGNSIESKNNILSSSYSSLNNLNSIIGATANLIENNNNKGNMANHNYNTINLDNKNNKNKNISKLTNIKIEKMPRNFSNPNNNVIQLNKNSSFNINTSPINKINKANNLHYNYQNRFEKNTIQNINNISNNNNATSVILNKTNDINKNNRYTEENNTSDNNNIIMDTKKLSIIDIPAPTFINYYSHNSKEEILNTFKYNPNLTIKEKAFFILLKSPVVPLSSQFIFSRSTKNIKKIISKKDILSNYEIYLNNKIKHFEENQILHNEIIKSVFNATKIAEITLNFITSDNEIQFNENYVLLLNNKEDYNFIFYKNYIKVIYYIINEKFEDENNPKVSDNRLLANLYDILSKKGYKKIKDYLYYIFIKNNNKKENIFMNNIGKINKLIKNECPKLICLDESLKMCRFVIYSMYLIKEIVDYGNKLKNTKKLQIEEKELIEKMKEKLEKFHNKYHNYL